MEKEMNKITKKAEDMPPKTEGNKGVNKSILITIGVVALIVIMGIAIGGGSSSKSSNKWNSLSKEEKAWYKRNYGNGQYNTYKKTIDNYKKTTK